MTTTQFRPAIAGGWLAIVSDARVLVIEPSGDELVREAWVAVSSADAVQSVLDLLTRKGLSATPSFALAVADDDQGLRVVLRGALGVTVTDAAGDQPVSSAGVSTWIERTFDRATGVTITAPHAESAEGIGLLPLISGVTWMSAVTLGETTEVAAVAPPVEVAAAAAAAAPPAVTPPAAPVAAQPTVEPIVTEAAVAPVAAEPAAAEAVAVAVPEIDIEATVTEIEPEPMFPPPPPPGAEAPASGSYDYLFGDTMYRSVADAAVREPEEEDEEPETAAAESEGDHDGHTVLTSDISRARGKRAPKQAPAAPPAPPEQPSVFLVLSTGPRTKIEQTVIIGRSPSVSKVSGGQMPTLLTIGGDQDISRNHAQVALEGGTPVVTDLHSRNGTSIVMPGREPQKLRAGEPTAVIIGTLIDLGGGVTLTVEED